MEKPITRRASNYSMYSVTYYHTGSDKPQTYMAPGNSAEEVWLATVRYCMTAYRAIAYHCVSILPVEKQESPGKDVQYVPTQDRRVPPLTTEGREILGGW